MSSVLVANLSAPEIARLAAEIERRGMLSEYVRPYVNKGRPWERLVERAPGVGRAYARTLGRRTPPPGLPSGKIREAGVQGDFAAAALSRLRFGPVRWRQAIAQKLVLSTEARVAMTAGRCVSSTNVDVVVASYGTGQFAFEAVRRAGGRAVLSYPIAHNRFQRQFYEQEAEIEPEFAKALPRLGELPAEYSERLEAECELADRILVGSGFVRESFISLGYDAGRITVAPYGVDTDRFTPRTVPRRGRPFRVLFVGQLGQRKGLSYLFKAYERFRKPDTELHIVGTFVPGGEVFERFRPLYRHTRNVPQSDLPALFHEADVFVFPSLIEGMPLVVLEAMACGIPVITTRNGPGDIVRDGIDGFFVPIRDPDAIEQRLEQLYRDPSLREQMSLNAREQALRHSWDRFSTAAADAVLTPI